MYKLYRGNAMIEKSKSKLRISFVNPNDEAKLATYLVQLIGKELLKEKSSVHCGTNKGMESNKRSLDRGL